MATYFVGINIIRHPKNPKLKALGADPLVQCEYFNIDHISRVFKNSSDKASFTMINDANIYETDMEIESLIEFLDNSISHYFDMQKNP